MGKAVPFREDAYRADDVMAFAVEPSKTVVEYESLLDKNAAIPETGCGEGQNVLYLANRGFDNIDAFDISEAGIAKLKKLCGINGVNLNAFVCDLTKYTFNKKYDLIMSFATLCFVEKDEWKKFIFAAKDNTYVGGIHIMAYIHRQGSRICRYRSVCDRVGT